MRRNPASLVHTQLTARRALAEPGSDAAAAAVAPDADDLELAFQMLELARLRYHTLPESGERCRKLIQPEPARLTPLGEKLLGLEPW